MHGGQAAAHARTHAPRPAPPPHLLLPCAAPLPLGTWAYNKRVYLQTERIHAHVRGGDAGIRRHLLMHARAWAHHTRRITAAQPSPASHRAGMPAAALLVGSLPSRVQPEARNHAMYVRREEHAGLDLRVCAHPPLPLRGGLESWPCMRPKRTHAHTSRPSDNTARGACQQEEGVGQTPALPSPLAPPPLSGERALQQPLLHAWGAARRTSCPSKGPSQTTAVQQHQPSRTCFLLLHPPPQPAPPAHTLLSLYHDHATT